MWSAPIRAANPGRTARRGRSPPAPDRRGSARSGSRRPPDRTGPRVRRPSRRCRAGPRGQRRHRPGRAPPPWQGRPRRASQGSAGRPACGWSRGRVTAARTDRWPSSRSARGGPPADRAGRGSRAGSRARQGGGGHPAPAVTDDLDTRARRGRSPGSRRRRRRRCRGTDDGPASARSARGRAGRPRRPAARWRPAPVRPATRSGPTP